MHIAFSGVVCHKKPKKLNNSTSLKIAEICCIYSHTDRFNQKSKTLLLSCFFLFLLLTTSFLPKMLPLLQCFLSYQLMYNMTLLTWPYNWPLVKLLLSAVTYCSAQQLNFKSISSLENCSQSRQQEVVIFFPICHWFLFVHVNIPISSGMCT